MSDVSGTERSGSAEDARRTMDVDDGVEPGEPALDADAGDDGARDPEVDPLSEDPRVQARLGEAYPTLERFHALLREQGVLRGLIGPREVGRLWERHLLNSASLAPYLPTAGTVVDVGSGAGLPGVVLAALLPGTELVLLEPMERRVTWLTEVTQQLGLNNVTVRRGRAEELHGAIAADAVTARAVAPMDRLARWTLPLLRPGGSLVVLKGRQAGAELDAARHVLRKLRASSSEILTAPTLPGLEPTTVVRVTKSG